MQPRIRIGELPPAPTPDGKLIPFVENLFSSNDEGRSWAFLPPGATVRASGIGHTILVLEGDEKAPKTSPNFLEVTPLVFASDTDYYESAVRRDGLLPDAFNEDNREHRFMPSGKFQCLLPDVKFFAAEALLAVLDGEPDDTTVREFKAHLPRSIILTDEGLTDPDRYYPRHFAEVAVIQDEPNPLTLVLIQDSEDRRPNLRPALAHPEHIPEGAIVVGTLTIDALKKAAGRPDHKHIGVTLTMVGPEESTDSRLAGWMIHSGSRLTAEVPDASANEKPFLKLISGDDSLEETA